MYDFVFDYRVTLFLLFKSFLCIVCESFLVCFWGFFCFLVFFGFFLSFFFLVFFLVTSVEVHDKKESKLF